MRITRGGNMKAAIGSLIAASLLSLSLSSCATPYQEMSFTGGVSATQIDANTLRISGRGNAFTDSTTIQDYVLVKAAEQTLALGYGSFEIINASNASRTGTVVVPGSATSYSTGTATAYGYGNTATAYGNSTTQTYYTPPTAIPYYKPGEDLLVKMHPGAKPSNAPANWYNAQEIMTYLGAKVKGH